MSVKVISHSILSDYDIDLFMSGHHLRLYEKFGSHVKTVKRKKGVYFAVYAPAARKVEVIGDFNDWNGYEHELNVRWDGSGVWEGFIPGIKHGALYKYRIYSNHDQSIREKADPFAQKYEMPPNTASVVWSKPYKWKDKEWMSIRQETNNLEAPFSVYELHLGSWKKTEDGGRSLHYEELAVQLVDYVRDMAYTHVELMPVMEHPYYPSWGYLCTGFFAPTSRYGDPEELKYLIDQFHKNKIGVILDWVPAHFPDDDHALADFDGSYLFEHPERGKGYHPDWDSLIFNYERPQIRSFLLSSAHYWLGQFHADGLRVDAVASMLYLDYSREEGQWRPNIHGGKEYLAAVEFIKELNASMYSEFPDIQMIAEESTAFPGVTKPTDQDGLGFGLKWMMGWMNDSLDYFKKDPIHRKYHHHEMSKSLTYAFSENYLLPLSHDEVVHGKGALVSKMPGDEWQRFANLRLLYMSMYTHPGQKLLFMGCEFGQIEEWNFNEGLPWHLLKFAPHQGVQEMVKDLNKIYRSESPMYSLNYSQEGFEWIDYNDYENTVLSFVRKSKKQHLIIVLNYSPIVREHYRIGVADKTNYKELFNSDRSLYWGSGIKNNKKLKSKKIEHHGRPYSLEISIPPLAGIILKPMVK